MTALRRGDAWMEHAACVGANPAIFHNPDRYDQALAVCAGCPVATPCAELGATMTGGGVWGGKALPEKRYRRADTRQYLLAPHGTDAAYRRHLRRNEQPCPNCRDTANTRQRGRR